MIERKAFSTESVPGIDSHLQERLREKVNTVFRDGQIMVEESPEEQPLFPTEAQEAARNLKKTLQDAGATMTVVAGGGQS